MLTLQSKLHSFLLQVFALVFLLVSSTVQAQTTADPAYANMQRAVGGIVNEHVKTKGYSTADPRVYQTLKGIGTAAVTGAAAAGASLLVAGSSVAWGTVLGTALVFSGVSYAVNLGLDAAIKWLFGSNGVTQTASPATNNTPALVQGGSAFCSDTSMNTDCASTQDALIASWIGQTCASIGAAYTCAATACPSYMTLPTMCAGLTTIATGFTQIYGSKRIYSTNNYQGLPCSAGNVLSAGTCKSNITPPLAPNSPLSTAANNLSPQQKEQPVDYQTLALLINKLWKDASAQSGYQGVPYTPESPITATEVQTFAQTNPSVYPSVSSLLAPIGTSGSSTVITGLSPSISTSYSINAPVITATQTVSPTTTITAPPSPTTDLGADPNIRFVPPEAPTAQSILDPILNMLPGWRTATFTATGDCPKPNISFAPFMNLTVTMESHCTLIEQNRALISSLMSGVWLLIAALIVLAA